MAPPLQHLSVRGLSRATIPAFNKRAAKRCGPLTDTLSQARRLIERRLSELQAEAARLDKALRELSLDDRPVTQGSGRKVGKRAPRGQRQRDFLAAVEAKPGIRASEVAREIGVSQNQAYALANKLRKQKKIRKSGKGYRLAPASERVVDRSVTASGD
jgi:hypothetical protein